MLYGNDLGRETQPRQTAAVVYSLSKAVAEMQYIGSGGRQLQVQDLANAMKAEAKQRITWCRISLSRTPHSKTRLFLGTVGRIGGSALSL